MRSGAYGEGARLRPNLRRFRDAPINRLRSSSPARAPRSAGCSARSRTSPRADLGGFAIKGALERAGVARDQVDYVIMGQVLQAGAGQIPARQAAVKARHPDDASRR